MVRVPQSVACSIAIFLGLIIGIFSGCGKKIKNPSALPRKDNRWKLFNYSVANTNSTDSAETETVSRRDFSGQTLQLLIWTNYLAAEHVQEFTKEYSAAVTITYYGSNQELYQRIRSGELYDIAMPSGHMVQRLMDENYLAELAPRLLPNIRFLDPQYRTNHYDPGNRFSIPYLWGTLGIGYNSEKISVAPRSWGSLFALKEEEIKSMEGKLSLTEEPRDIIGTALLFLGFSPNTRNTNELAKAVALVRSQADRLHYHFDSTQVADSLADGKTYLALAWSADVARAAERNHKIRYSMPDEGLLTFVDNFVILKSAPPNQRILAEYFLNFLLRPTVAARICNYSYYASALLEAKSGIDRHIINGPSYMLPENRRHAFSLNYDPATQVFLDSTWSQSVLGSAKQPSR
jgi:spermidine/putrescine transport system substrate-binding protein